MGEKDLFQCDFDLREIILKKQNVGFPEAKTMLLEQVFMFLVVLMIIVFIVGKTINKRIAMF